MSTKRMIYISLFICLLTICSWITVPFTVPFTMQTFAVFCVLLMLGGKDGMIVIALYIFLGLVGVPVFSGFRGGIGHLLGPTGGYILGFLATALFYRMFEKKIENNPKITFSVLVLGLFLCYVIGSVWFGYVFISRGTKYSIISIFTMCVFPYILPDLAKLFLAIRLSGYLKPVLDLRKSN